MLMVHATKKLAQRLGGFSTLGTDDVKVPALGAWYATAVFWKPQVAVFVSEATLLPVVVPLAPAGTLLARFPVALAEMLDGQGVPAEFIRDEVAMLTAARCVPTANRSLIGVMNEYVRLAEHARHSEPGTPDLLAVSHWLAQVPMSPLDKRHGSADRELAALVASVR
jgi:hypothetical protein